MGRLLQSSGGIAAGDSPTWTGQHTFAAGTITDSKPFTITQTWNDAADTFVGFLQNITATASAAASKFIDCQLAGVTAFAVRKDGQITSYADANNNFTLGAGSSAANLTSARSINLLAGSGWAITLAASGNFRFGGQGGYADIATDATGVWAHRAGATAQASRIYRTYTDASNYERLALQTAAGYVELAAETAGTGTDDIDVRLTPAGAGLVRYGTHSAIAAETITGFITMKDDGGTTRKVAIVS